MIHNVCKGWLEGGASNQESVHVLLLYQVSCVFLGDTAAIYYSHVVWLRDCILQCCSQPSMHFLGLLWSGCLTCSDGPDGLIGQDNIIVPGRFVTKFLHDLLEWLKLSTDDLLCFVGLPLLVGFSEAEDNLQAIFQGVFDFVSHQLISFTKQLSPLRVSKDDPVDIEVLQMQWTT